MCRPSCITQPVAQMLRRPILRDQPIGQGRVTALHRHDQRRLGCSRLAERSISPRETASGLCDRLDYALLGLIVGRTFLLGAIGEAGVAAVQLALARRAGAWMAQQLRRRLSRESLSVPATAAARL